MPEPSQPAAGSPVSNFEAAVDAIVSGDLAGLRKLLHDDPELVRARSAREHHSTLLHYVSANGVEDVRQKTPANIVEITKLLLHSGAEVDAESDAYGADRRRLVWPRPAPIRSAPASRTSSWAFCWSTERSWITLEAS